MNSELIAVGKGMHLLFVSKSSRCIFIIHTIFILLLQEPMFVDAHVIPDGTDPNDAKVYFFFKEKLTDNNRSTKQIHSMIARICPVSALKFLFKEIIQIM